MLGLTNFKDFITMSYLRRNYISQQEKHNLEAKFLVAA